MLPLITFLVLVFSSNVHGDYFIECEQIESTQIYIASEKGCSFYIFCNGMDSFDGECEDGYYFSAEYQTCDQKELVDCRLDTSTSRPFFTTIRPTTITTTTRRITTRLTTTTTSSAVSRPQISSIKPLFPTTLFNTTASVTEVTQSTPESTSRPLSNTSVVTIPPFVVYSACPTVDNPYQMVFVPHPRSCSDYFMCYHGKTIPMHCSAMLHFNVRNGKCDYAENARCRVNNSLPKEQCQSHTVDVYPHSTNCNYYYDCKNGYLMLQHCPLLFGWDVERRACLPLSQTKCYNKLNQGNSIYF